MNLRPMTVEDAPAVRRLAAEAFAAGDRAAGAAPDPEPSPDQAARGDRRMAHPVRTDPGGAWLAESDGSLVGVALATVREGVWGLSLLVVRPDLQARGVGRALLDRTLAYGADAPRGLICSSEDPRAIRRYALAGFRLLPALMASGPVHRTALPALSGVRRGPGDPDFADAVDREVRGAGHGPDHERMAADGTAYLLEEPAGRGYAYAAHDPDRTEVWAVVATSPRTAQRLLWQVLADASGPAQRHYLTAAQGWATDVLLAARLSLRPSGPLCVRGMPEPSPYLISGSYL